MVEDNVTAHLDVTPNTKSDPFPFYMPSLPYLPDDDSTYYVYSIQGFTSEGPEIDDLRIRVVLLKFPAAVLPTAMLRHERIRVDVPLSDFRFFGMGSTFYKRQQISRKFDSVERSISSFRPRIVVEGFIGRTSLNDPAALHVFNKSLLEDFKPVYGRDGLALLEGMHRGQPIYFPMMETFRFYFGSFDRLTRQLLLCYAYPEFEAPLPWNEETTGSDGETFVISPHSDFADHASCLQMALLLSNPDLMTIIKSIADSIRGIDLRKAVISPIMEFPYDAKNMHVLIRQTHLKRNKDANYEKARVSQQILSDNREMKFSRLLIRDPRREPTQTRKNVQGPVKPLHQIDVDKDFKNPPDGAETLDPFAPTSEKITPPGFIEAFPGIERTKVRVDYVKPKSVAPVRPDWMERIAGRFGRRKLRGLVTDETLPPGPSKRNTMRPPLRSRNRGGKTIFERESGYQLFLPVRDLDYREVRLRDIDLDPRVQCTVEALRICRNDRYMQSKYGKVLFRQAAALEFNASFDGGAKAIRHVIYSSFVIQDKSGAVIELLRRNEKSIAMGIVLRTESDEFRASDVARVMSHYRRRINLRGADDRTGRENYAGVWPTHDDYDDVRGERLTHRQPFDSPKFLADEIYRIVTGLSR